MNNEAESGGAGEVAGNGRGCCGSLAGGVIDWGRRLLADLAMPPSGPRFRLLAGVLLPLLLCIGLTLWARVSGFDLGAQEMIYRVGSDSWSLGNHPFWKTIYVWGVLPSVVVVLSALVAFSLSWYWQSLRRWRRVFLFVILTAVIGPGVITNGILKEYWGRPRPRDIEGMGGHNAFEPVFSRHDSSSGKSFPCGHATVGFYFLGGYFLFRRHRRAIAEGFLFIGLTSGILLGIARMAQGGHFFTDVIWAGAICYFTPMVLYHALGIDRSLVLEDRGTGEPMPRWIKIGISLLTVAIITGVLLASPYQNSQNYFIINEFAKKGPLDLYLRFTVGEVEIVPAEEFRVIRESAGHGVPTSRIAIYYDESQGSGFSNVVYAERISGWFSEINVTTRIEIPWQRIRELKLETASANVRIDLPAVAGNSVIQVLDGGADIQLRPHGQPVTVDSESEVIRIEGALPVSSEEKEDRGYRLKVNEKFSGFIKVEDKIRR